MKYLAKNPFIKDNIIDESCEDFWEDTEWELKEFNTDNCQRYIEIKDLEKTQQIFKIGKVMQIISVVGMYFVAAQVFFIVDPHHKVLVHPLSLVA